MIGRKLGQYEILEELGRGGMGVVYRALDPRLGREVALKVLGSASAATPRREGRLRREARAAARLVHPAISVVYEIDDADGATFISMELVRGRPLAAAAGGGADGARPGPGSRDGGGGGARRRPTPTTWCTATSSRRT